MNLAQLQQRLGQSVQVDLPSLFDRYRAEQQSEDLDGFVAYLVKARVLDATMVKELYAETDVEIAPGLVANQTLLSRRTGGTLIVAPARGRSTEEGEPAPRAANGAPRNIADVETVVGGFTATEAGGSSPRTDLQEARYEPIARLGQGAMGAVDVARDVLLRRRVALKTVLPAMASHKALLDRFLCEMQITAQLEHPNIVPVYALQVGADGALGYAMKLVNGKDLSQLLAETREHVRAGKPLPAHLVLEQRLEIFLKVCDALEYAHAKGIVHRDLKPSNIMVGKHNEVYLMDWGIARPMGAGGQAIDAGIEITPADGDIVGMRTRVGATIGTPTYMSPEQAAGRNHELDGRSDLYTMGLILQECVTLAQAVGGKTLEEVLTKAREARRDPVSVDGEGATMPRELEAIVRKATALEVTARYPSVRALGDEVRRVLRNEPLEALPDGAVRKVTRWISRHRTAALALMMSLALLGSVATIVTQRVGQARLDAIHESELRQSEFEMESVIAAQRIDRKLARYEIALSQLAGAVQAALPASTADSLPGALAPAFQEALLDTAGVHSHALSPAAARAHVAAGTPALRARLVLASGHALAFPGPAEPTAIDAAHDPAYVAAAGKPGVHWSSPLQGGATSVLPVSTAVYEGAALRGVAVLEIAMDRLLEERGPLELDYVQTRLLLARDGTVRGEQNAEGGRAPLAKEVVDAVAAGRSGSVEYDGDGRRWMATYYSLTALDWSFVSIADMGRMLASTKALVSSDARAAPRGSPTPTAIPAAPPAPAPPTPTASASVETAPSASAPPVESAAPAPTLGGPWPAGGGPSAAGPAAIATQPPGAEPSAAPSAPPAASSAPRNPFDKWDVYKK